MKYKYFLLLLYLISLQTIYPEDKNFVVIITSFNNKDWYIQNLNSVFEQTYQNYHIIYMDDCSPDGTGNLVEEYIKKQGQEHKVTLIKNNEWQSQMANHYTAAHMCDDDTIIIHLDGDDWLNGPDVLVYLNDIYQDPNIWMTYGQCLQWPDNSPGPSKPIPQEALEFNNFRSTHWMYGHPRSFYAWLFKLIKLSDLILDNSFAKTSPSPDAAIMIPMLEMSRHHTKFIEKNLYVWNKKNPLSQITQGIRRQWDYIITVQSWPSYHALEKPHKNQNKNFEECMSDLLLFINDDFDNYTKFIESISSYVLGINKVYIFYDEAKQICNIPEKTDNIQIIKKRYNLEKGVSLYSSLFSLRFILKNHIIITDGQKLFINRVNISDCIQELERTFSLGFYFGHDFSSISPEQYIPISQTVGAWQFQYATDILKMPFKINALFRKKYFLSILNAVYPQNIDEFTTYWNELNNKECLINRNTGLFLRNIKIMA